MEPMTASEILAKRLLNRFVHTWVTGRFREIEYAGELEHFNSKLESAGLVADAIAECADVYNLEGKKLLDDKNCHDAIHHTVTNRWAELIAEREEWDNCDD